MRITAKSIVTFGKFKGRLWGDVPTDYIAQQAQSGPTQQIRDISATALRALTKARTLKRARKQAFGARLRKNVALHDAENSVAAVSSGADSQ